MRYVIALDQGTTSSRSIVFDEKGRIVSSHAIEFTQHYPQPGWVEHNPEDILQTQISALQIAVQKAGIDVHDIVCVGITNQRETTLLWEKDTGRAVYPAIVWQCRRTAAQVEKLFGEGLEGMIRAKTGLTPDAYFSATKIQWIMQNVEGVSKRAKAGEICFGTVDTFLAFHLTQQHVHVTDPSNASRTMLYNIYDGCWDEELLQLLDIPEQILPSVVDSSGVIGNLREDILGIPIPIAALAGDQHAALFGQACFDLGMVKTTYGTGGFLLMNTGDSPIRSERGLLTTIAWSIDGKREYALEGSIFVAGALIQWLRDELGLIKEAAESEKLALSVPDANGAIIVPAFTGLGAPYWDMYARGTILGLTRGVSKAHLVRAALEAIAYQTADVISAMEKDSGVRLPQMRADGGASQNNFLMQYQADILGIQVLRPKVTETTALGAALLAGLACGVWADKKQIESVWEQDVYFSPQRDSAWRSASLQLWHKAVERSRDWAQ